MSLDLFSMMPKWHSLAHDTFVARYFAAVHMHYRSFAEFADFRPYRAEGTTYLDDLPFGPSGNNLTIGYRPWRELVAISEVTYGVSSGTYQGPSS